ncbi:MAG TPA: hypothetical protein VFV38_19145 [Ktedonobacteraceae bacterium]|nr:hypothetical protein [Ktedonobacteraceae bacterium]
MLYAIDIDSTIAIDRTGCARFLNKHLRLGIDDSTLAGLAGYWAFLELAPVQEFRARAEEAYQEALKRSDDDLTVLAEMEPLPGAVSSVQRLAEHDHILYVTCRKKANREATRAWLAWAGFPSATNVATCDWYHSKYLHAYERAGEREQIVLIDDMMEQIVRSFGRVARDHTQIALSLLRRMEVVGFGHKSLPPLPEGVPFAHSLLANWGGLETWLESKKERESV